MSARRQLTLSDARRLMHQGKPWCFRLEYTGLTANGNASDKFWLATGRGRHEPVEVRYGKVGTEGRVIVKDWMYVEGKAPEKVAKGYDYVSTPFVGVRQQTIDGFGAQQAPVPPPKPVAPVVAPAAPAAQQDAWEDRKAGVHCQIRSGSIVLVIDPFPSWQKSAGYAFFKGELEAVCQQHTGSRPRIGWSTDGPNQDRHTFSVPSNDRGLFKALVAWLRQQIGVLAAPVNPPPGLTGPYAKIATVKPVGDGVWYALNALGNKVMDLTKQGARDLVADYPHITIAGL